MSAEAERLRRERDLYRTLLGLSEQEDLTKSLRAALEHVISATEAEQGLLELVPETDDDGPPCALTWACSDEDVAAIKRVISRGILAEALACGEIVQTPSAILDERFAERASVQRNAIEAVICAPLGREDPIGVLYLQGSTGAGAFSEEDVALVEAFSRHATPILRLLRSRERRQRRSDPTLPWRRKLRLDAILGASPALAKIFEQVALIAPLQVTVLLSGPSGSGKTLLARAIHDNGPRATGPFLELNCAALPEGLLESELFGALTGAHSTAHTKRLGKVAAAEGGTLFLDEITELSLAGQAKLLQLLQSNTYVPLGGTTPVQADIRVLAATNVDLRERVSEGSFRTDLYYRLNVFPIRMPALKERREDLPLLARGIVRRLSVRQGLPQLEFTPGAVNALQEAEWPGNIRQLENVVFGGLVRANAAEAERIECTHLFPETAFQERPLTFQAATRSFQRRLLAQALEEHGWNVKEVSVQLDLSRSQTYSLIKAHGLRGG